MKRRTALRALADPAAPSAAVPDDTPASEFANTVLPKVQRTAAGLEPYSGPWGDQQVRHLLRRTMFGARKGDMAVLLGKNVNGAVDLLLAPPPAEPSQPLITDGRDFAPVGESWVYLPTRSPDPLNTYNPNGLRVNSLKAWWFGLMLNQPLSIREKMVLFWHNHFVTEIADVGDARFSYHYSALLRANALGNFKELTRLVTLDGAMLRYLNGNSNTRTSPNENYGRELQELFTIGKGPEIAPGDYTTYTEADVKAAAKVLTGWRDDSTALTTPGAALWTFDSTRHDATTKQFSSHYGNAVITGRTGTDGQFELNDLLTMIFAQPETARAICRKLYRWFVYYVIDEATEASVIEPMAANLRSNNYEIRSALSMLLKSAHFYDTVNMGCVIKSPLDLVIGMCREFDVVFPADLVKQYGMNLSLVSQSATLQQSLGDPPNVAGWGAYYQTPQYYELWINSDTLPRRSQFADRMARTGYTSSGATLLIDVLAFAKGFVNPSDPNALVDEAARTLFAIAVTQKQRDFLKQTLLPGLPDYEWTIEWNNYLASPTDPQKVTPVKSKLQALVSFMMQMPEFHLS